MVPQPLPRAFELLEGQRSKATDAALVEAVPHLDGAARQGAMRILVRRGHTASLIKLIGLFPKAAEDLRAPMLAQVGNLAEALRAAIDSDSFTARAGAIRLIAAGDEAHLAYLLVDALRMRCARTRALAAAALRDLTSRLFNRDEGEATSEDPKIISPRHEVAESLRRALRAWESHERGEVLEAALWISDWVDKALVEKIQDPHTKIVGTLRTLIERTADPRMARFIVRALGIALIRDSAARAISRASDPRFVRALISQSAQLTDPEIARGWRRIQECPWLNENSDLLVRLTGPQAEQAVQMLAAAGGSQQEKMQTYRALLDIGTDDVRQAVLKKLTETSGEPATRLLTLLANRTGDALAPIAAVEVQRRRSGGGEGAPIQQQLAETPERITADDPAARRELRARLASSDPLERARALRDVRQLGAAGQFAAAIYQAAHDPEPAVRSMAVAMLVDLPGRASERILRAAIDDPDERVQANAIEALDRLDLPERVQWTASKLDARSGRVRANAIKSLLRTELDKAGHALLDMLDDSSRAHRLSALWVIERLHLNVVLARLGEMSQHDNDFQVRKRARRILRMLAADQAAAIWWHDIAEHPEGADDGEET